MKQVDLYAWQTGIGRGWPFTANEEHNFVASLPVPPARVNPDRHDITSALLCLREGADIPSFQQQAPYSDVVRLASAYQLLAHRLHHGRVSWLKFAGDPCADTAVTYSATARGVAEVPTTRLSTAIADGHVSNTARITTDVLERMDATVDIALAVEQLLDTHTGSSAMRIGARLFDPHTSGLWSDPYFLPTRVGQLCPVRVATLLGER